MTYRVLSLFRHPIVCNLRLSRGFRNFETFGTNQRLVFQGRKENQGLKEIRMLICRDVII